MIQRQITFPSNFLRQAIRLTQLGLLLAVLTALFVGATAFVPHASKASHSFSGTFADTSAVQICAGESFIFGEDTLTASGIYTDTLIAGDGTDSIVSVDLTVLPTSATLLTASICANETYVFGGDTLHAAGTYVDTLSNTQGCDSIVTLKLNVLPLADSTFSATTCSNEPYNFNGVLLTASGEYVDTLTAENGCDSIVTLQLTVLPVAGTDLSAAICADEFYDFNGTVLNTTGTYTDVLTAENGCDSIITLTLTVFPVPTTLLSARICEGTSYAFGGNALDTTGTYTDTLKTVHGCDSILVLNLRVQAYFDDTLSVSICPGDAYVFGLDTLEDAGIYTDSLQAIGGCDSIVTLLLDFYPIPQTLVEATICANETYSFGGETLNLEGVYTDTLTSQFGCDLS